VLAALAGVRAGHAHVGHPPLVQVERGADQRPRGHLDHHRPIPQIQQDRPVGSVGVQGEADLLGLGGKPREDPVGGHPDRRVALKMASPDTVGKKNR
jgi:hypothetical protein